MSSPDYHSESRSGINPFHSADGHRFLQRNKARCILRYELSGLASEGTINEMSICLRTDSIMELSFAPLILWSCIIRTISVTTEECSQLSFHSPREGQNV